MTDYYTVEFRLYGTELDPDGVTQELGVRPSIVQRKGESAGGGRPFKESAWGLARTNNDGGVAEWGSLQEGLEDVLELLEPLKSKIIALDPALKRVFWCGFFHKSIGSGARLDAAILTKIVALGAEIELSIYYCEEGSV